MFRFCIYIIKILIISFGLAFIIQLLSDYGLKNSEQIFRHWNSILNGKINSEIIIIGSSRGVVSYDPDIFERKIGLTTFNLSFDAAPYNLQKIKLETYLVNNIAPKIVIQNVDMAHFNKSNTIPNDFQFIPFMGNNYLHEELKKVDSDFGNYYFIPLVKYNGSANFLKIGLLNVFNNPSKHCYQAYSPRNISFKIDSHNIERLKNLEKNSEAFIQYQYGLESLEKFLIELPSDITVFLVWAPEHFERLKYAQNVRWKIEAYLEDIDNKFSNVYFINYSKDPISKESHFFYDTFHLNENGASLFSEKVSIDIAEILN